MIDDDDLDDPQVNPFTDRCHAFAREYLDSGVKGSTPEDYVALGEAVAELLCGWTAGYSEDLLPHLERIRRLREGEVFEDPL